MRTNGAGGGYAGRGMAALTKARPDWPHRLDLATFDMSRPGRSMLVRVLRCAAPAAEIYCANVFNLAGSALEADAIPKLDRALDEGYGLFNLTISASAVSSSRSRRSTPGAGGFARAKAWRAWWRPGTTAWTGHSGRPPSPA